MKTVHVANVNEIQPPKFTENELICVAFQVSSHFQWPTPTEIYQLFFSQKTTEFVISAEFIQLNFSWDIFHSVRLYRVIHVPSVILQEHPHGFQPLRDGGISSPPDLPLNFVFEVRARALLPPSPTDTI